MINLELFQIYHLKEMSLSAELFLSCSILQLTFYAISTAYSRKSGFIVLNHQIFYIGFLLTTLSLFLLLNEDLLLINEFSSNNFITNDYLSFATKLMICITSSAFLVIINIFFGNEYIQNNFEYVILLSLSILGLLLLCSANDLVTAYLAIELHSIAFYIMAAFKRDSSYSIESGLKYFVIGALSSTLFLFGSSIIYGFSGTLLFNDLNMFFSIFNLQSQINEISKTFLLVQNIDYLLDQSILSSILDYYMYSNTFVYLPQPYFSSSDNLIDWCYLNYAKETKSLLVVLNDFEFVSLIQDFSVYPVFSNFIIDFVNSIFLLDSILTQELNSGFLVFCHEIYLASFSGFNELFSNLNNNQIVLKQIYELYENSIVSSLVTMDKSGLDFSFVSIGFFFVCAGLFIKLSIAPFHFWSLDVYEGSPNTATFFFSVIPKISLFVLLMRLCYISFYQIFIDDFQFFFFWLAILSIFVGSFGGIEQRKLKTLMAYSSISHTGYLLLSFSTGNLEGIQMMFYYLAIYMISGLAFWAVYLFLVSKNDIYSNKNNKELADLVLLKQSNPVLAFILAITLFSLAGIPPLVGFLIKLGVFSAIVNSSAHLASFVGIVLTVISTFYYIRLIKILYFENVLVGKLYFPINSQKSLLLAILSLALIIFCIDPTLIYLLFYKAALLIN